MDLSNLSDRSKFLIRAISLGVNLAIGVWAESLYFGPSPALNTNLSNSPIFQRVFIAGTILLIVSIIDGSLFISLSKTLGKIFGTIVLIIGILFSLFVIATALIGNPAIG